MGVMTTLSIAFKVDKRSGLLLADAPWPVALAPLWALLAAALGSVLHVGAGAMCGRLVQI